MNQKAYRVAIVGGRAGGFKRRHTCSGNGANPCLAGSRITTFQHHTPLPEGEVHYGRASENAPTQFLGIPGGQPREHP